MEDVFNILAYVSSNLLIDIVSVKCWLLCFNKQILITKQKILLSILVMMFFTILFDNIFITPLRYISTFVLLFIIAYFIFSKDLLKSILAIIVSQLMMWISEYLIIILTIFFTNLTIETIKNNGMIFYCFNLYIVLISLCLLKLELPQKIYNVLNKSLYSVKIRELIFYILMIVSLLIISTTESYMKLSLSIVLTTNVIIAIIFIIIIVRSSSVKSKYNNVNNKYETSISSLKQYEAMIDKYRLYNHENKNELQTLRNLISKKNTKALKYIDGILEDKIKDNEKIMRKTFKIPEGGLRAIIYGKLCKMDELGIKYSLDIARDVRTVDLINMDEEIVLNICKILGVFLDNAIEAVKNLKEKQITIEIYLIDEKLCIDITNNFEGKLELDKLDKEKYTTKGKNHGYGLSLVKQIIDDNSNIFENEKSISRNTFTQKIKIKM